MNTPLSSADTLLPAPVLVVEDEMVLQQRIKRLLLQLGYQEDMLSFVSTVADATTHINNEPLALALIDLGLPDGNGISLIEQLVTSHPSTAILVVSAWTSEQAIIRALQAGATGYVLKERDDLEILFSIRSVLRGGAPIDPFVARHILEQLPQSTTEEDQVSANVVSPLSKRQSEILLLVAEGLSNREIADDLLLSRYTVECHIKNIYQKLAVSSRTKAINEARAQGWLPSQ